MAELPIQDADLQAALDICPFHRLFKMEIVPEPNPEELVIKLSYTPSVERMPSSRQYHGGVLASLGDIAGSVLIYKVTGAGGGTMHYAIEYLRPAVNTDVFARAKLRRLGKTVGFVDVELTSAEGKAVALCRGVFAVGS